MSLSPDGRHSAIAEGNGVRIVDLLKPAGSPWLFPVAAERKRYHAEQANLAEQKKRWFAAAFHLGRLLLDEPNNSELRKRREDAMGKAMR